MFFVFKLQTVIDLYALFFRTVLFIASCVLCVISVGKRLVQAYALIINKINYKFNTLKDYTDHT